MAQKVKVLVADDINLIPRTIPSKYINVIYLKIKSGDSNKVWVRMRRQLKEAMRKAELCGP